MVAVKNSEELRKAIEHNEDEILIDDEELARKMLQFRRMKIITKRGLIGVALRVDRPLTDGELLPYCGGIQIIHTPGHTPGHICLYHAATKTLIAGDSLFVEGGKLAPAPAFINADTPLALQSLIKLTRVDIANVIAYHGGLFQDSPNARLAEIVH